MKFKSAFILFFLFAAACQEVVLLQDLQQRDANEILVLLHDHDIKAKKEAVTRQQVTSYTLMVSASKEAEARGLLVKHNLPRQRSLGLLGICQETGMIPTPKVEKCREMLALKGEIINSLLTIPAVVDADVVLNIPEPEEFPLPDTIPPRPTASVVVRTRIMKEGDPPLDEKRIQSFVANTISGMDARDVSVILSQPIEPKVEVEKAEEVATIEEKSDLPEIMTPPVAEATQPERNADDTGVVEDIENLAMSSSQEWSRIAGVEVSSEHAKRLKWIIAAGLLVFVVLAITIMYLVLRQGRQRAQNSNSLPVPLEVPSETSS